MTSRDPSFRCAAASSERSEPLAGTASTVRAFLLVEHAGPWGVDAPRDARLPDGLGAALVRACAVPRVRPLVMRRPGRRDEPAGVRVFAAFADHSRPWIESTVLDDPHELLDLDLSALGEGRSLGLTAWERPLFCVCTHGRHDACCAELGRRVAAGLAAQYPDETWEVSHIGGDRFAGNMMILPQGLYYGRMEPAAALAVADGHLAGHLELGHLRGRSSYAMPVQFAEVALRRHLGATQHDAITLESRQLSGDRTVATFRAPGSRWTVRVRTEQGPDLQQLTCRSARDNPIPQHRVVEMVEVL